MGGGNAQVNQRQSSCTVYLLTTSPTFPLRPSLTPSPSFSLLLQKTAMARAKNAEKAAKAKKGGSSQLKSNVLHLTNVCNICRQSFAGTFPREKLKEHSDAKHPKQAFEDCFPSFQG